MPDALYWGDEEIVFSVTHTRSWMYEPVKDSYTEMDWLTPDEIRFLSSILLCEESSGAKVTFYPIHHYSPILNRKRLDLCDVSTAEAIRDAVLVGLHRPSIPYNATRLLDCVRLRYSLIEMTEFEVERQRDYWEKIQLSDHVLLRGMSALVKASMLAMHDEFFEEATIQCFVAMEASFHLVQRILRAGGCSNPSAKDAANWLHECFDRHIGFAAPLNRYFEEFYDQRVMTLHPSSRLGDSLYAPLSHDDYFHLRDSLRAVFGYIVSGKHDRGFENQIAQLRR